MHGPYRYGIHLSVYRTAHGEIPCAERKGMETNLTRPLLINTRLAILAFILASTSDVQRNALACTVQ